MSTNLKETSPLELYGHNLTALAQQGKFTPLSGYEAVIDRAFEILLRKTKCLPILIDNTPTRPDIIVMEVARRIVTGEVPEPLSGKQLFSLDYEALFANTEIREAVTERLQAILTTLCQPEGLYILFVNPFHRLVSSRDGVDVATELVPLLARRQIQLIGACPLAEYRQYLERDAALQRRFQEICLPGVL